MFTWMQLLKTGMGKGCRKRLRCLIHFTSLVNGLWNLHEIIPVYSRKQKIHKLCFLLYNISPNSPYSSFCSKHALKLVLSIGILVVKKFFFVLQYVIIH